MSIELASGLRPGRPAGADLNLGVIGQLGQPDLPLGVSVAQQLRQLGQRADRARRQRQAHIARRIRHDLLASAHTPGG